ncbi:MAG: 16S rRNA (guanine(527)-N(7))-methyltransferase RsmG [Bacteroidetes bacterium B1(2017)]|nr:MAG: 16S rRNA (guanine(527)-N(7))-methyltransferase RsmG [Bacteroidetes bacterium B1(2017)]
MVVQIIKKYFPNLSAKQLEQFGALQELYGEWNAKINVISRKDIESLYEKHILHSMAIAKFIEFKPNTRILDIGTGGGFPGVPLAILFPESTITMVDSIAKKIKVAEGVSEAIGLTNTDFAIGRVEQLKESFHFITARAVAPADQLYKWTQEYVDSKEEFNSKINGYIFLKGGDLKEELKAVKQINKKLVIEEVSLSNYYEEEFFETKKLIYMF